MPREVLTYCGIEVPIEEFAKVNELYLSILAAINGLRLNSSLTPTPPKYLRLNKPKAVPIAEFYSIPLLESIKIEIASRQVCGVSTRNPLYFKQLVKLSHSRGLRQNVCDIVRISEPVKWAH